MIRSMSYIDEEHWIFWEPNGKITALLKIAWQEICPAGLTVVSNEPTQGETEIAVKSFIDGMRCVRFLLRDHSISGMAIWHLPRSRDSLGDNIPPFEGCVNQAIRRNYRYCHCQSNDFCCHRICLGLFLHRDHPRKALRLLNAHTPMP